VPDEPASSDSTQSAQTQDPPETEVRPAPDNSWMGEDLVRKHYPPDGPETTEG